MDKVHIPVNHMYVGHYGKIRSFFINLGEGLYHGYPLCCILRFSFDQMMMDGKVVPIEKGSAVRRGSKNNPSNKKDPTSLFVPCCIFHQPDELYPTDLLDQGILPERNINV